jgi:hypothetical protein
MEQLMPRNVALQRCDCDKILLLSGVHCAHEPSTPLLDTQVLLISTMCIILVLI